MSAQLVDRTYSGGTRFTLVECQECLLVLNSGHHYPPKDRHHAEKLADQHNAERH